MPWFRKQSVVKPVTAVADDPPTDVAKDNQKDELETLNAFHLISLSSSSARALDSHSFGSILILTMNDLRLTSTAACKSKSASICVLCLAF
jgi:hypothetical protein